MKLLEVVIWNQLVGVLIWNEDNNTSSFEYAPSFIKKKLELSPLVNPLSSKIIEAKAGQNYTNVESMTFDTSKGLPLFISDSLPDKFGTALFTKYLEKEGKNYRDLTPLEKLSYIGSRGMGALEFRPSKNKTASNENLDIKKLNQLSQSLLNNEPVGNIDDMANLFHIGTSPGGAQPKVLINIDTKTGNIYRGDQIPGKDQKGWILKFNRDNGSTIDQHRGKIEYVYYLIACKAQINIMESQLIEIDGEHYFMTQRFDRVDGQKIHTQTLHAFAGMNFKLPNTYSYEQIFTTLNQVKMDYEAREQLFRVMVFNVIGRNVDDHTKNFGFNMDQSGAWHFSPAYDLTFSYNENYKRVTPHFLSINGKNGDFEKEDLLRVAKEYAIKSPQSIIEEIETCFKEWESIARENRIPAKVSKHVKSKFHFLSQKSQLR